MKNIYVAIKLKVSEYGSNLITTCKLDINITHFNFIKLKGIYHIVNIKNNLYLICSY